MGRMLNKRALCAMSVGVVALLYAQWFDPDSAGLARAEMRGLRGGSCTTESGVCNVTENCQSSPSCYASAYPIEICGDQVQRTRTGNDDDLVCLTSFGTTDYSMYTCRRKEDDANAYCARQYQCYWMADHCAGHNEQTNGAAYRQCWDNYW